MQIYQECTTISESAT